MISRDSRRHISAFMCPFLRSPALPEAILGQPDGFCLPKEARYKVRTAFKYSMMINFNTGLRFRYIHPNRMPSQLTQ